MQRTILHHVPINLPALHDPEDTTARLAKKITLDLNDSELLVDNLQPATSAEAGVRLRHKRDFGRDGLSQGLNQRYNISNDEAYDMLKENHQQKIRGTLGHQAIEHSLPALRLQWPFVCITCKPLREAANVRCSTKQSLKSRKLARSIAHL